MSARRKRRPTIADERLAGTLLGDSCCCWIDLPEKEIELLPLKLPDGRQIEPGAIVTNLGGKRTSASYTRVRMLDGEFLTYRGKCTRLDGTLVLFDTRQPKDNYRVCFWLFDPHFTLCHFTPACSSRLVELTHCEFTNPNQTDGQKKETEAV